MTGGALLGVDLGTSSVKVVLTDARGTVRSRAARPYPVRTPGPGAAESDPGEWEEAAAAAVRSAVDGAGQEVVAVGLSGQMHGVVLCGHDGTPLRPALLWPDTRARHQAAELRTRDQALLDVLSNPVVAGMAGPLLAWVAESEPDVLEQSSWALSPKDWLRLRLTGEAATEPSDASATLLYDVPGDRWAVEVMEALGLRRDLFAPVVASSAVAGVLTSETAAAWRLAAETPVAAGAADAAAAAVGTGLLTEHTLQLTLGTGGQLLMPLTQPLGAPERGRHLYRTALRHGWYAMAATLGAGLALDWVTRAMNASFDELYAAAEKGAQPHDPLFVPHLVGERTPYLDADLRGSWTGLGLDHGREALLRSAVEGVALALRLALDTLPSLPPDVPVRLTGGGSRAPGMRRLLADALGRSLVAVQAEDASARGAALLAGVAAGLLAEDDLLGLAPALVPVAEPTSAGTERAQQRLAAYRAVVEELAQPADVPVTRAS